MSATRLSILSTTEIEDCISPYVREYPDLQSPKWTKMLERVKRKSLSREAQNLSRRPEDLVKTVYEKTWSAVGESGLPMQPKMVACLWDGRPVIMDPIGIKRAYLLHLYSILAEFSPQCVLEIGCGAGTNLFLLANRFPATHFVGLELTRAGIEQCDRLRKQELPSDLVEFSPEPLPSYSAHRKIQFVRGSAADLPFADGQFDCVLTILALEQMENIRARALTEIARVSAKHVVMVEPFDDWNKDDVRRTYIDSLGYFTASMSDLPDYGLMPRFAIDNFPAKLNYGVGLVVADSRTGSIGRLWKRVLRTITHH